MLGTLAFPTVNPLFQSPEFPLCPTEARRSLCITPPRRRITCMASAQAFVDAHSVTDSCRSSASLYEILRVKQNASPTEIKMAYRNLAKVYHPDSLLQSEADGQDFIEIHNAYATLSDPAARAVYDLSLDSRRRRSSLGNRTGFYTTRRWETDQCW